MLSNVDCFFWNAVLIFVIFGFVHLISIIIHSTRKNNKQLWS